MVHYFICSAAGIGFLILTVDDVLGFSLSSLDNNTKFDMSIPERRRTETQKIREKKPHLFVLVVFGTVRWGFLGFSAKGDDLG